MRSSQGRNSQNPLWSPTEAEGRKLEEDVALKILTADFRTLATVARSSRDYFRMKGKY